MQISYECTCSFGHVSEQIQNITPGVFSEIMKLIKSFKFTNAMTSYYIFGTCRKTGETVKWSDFVNHGHAA